MRHQTFEVYLAQWTNSDTADKIEKIATLLDTHLCTFRGPDITAERRRLAVAFSGIAPDTALARAVLEKLTS